MTSSKSLNSAELKVHSLEKGKRGISLHQKKVLLGAFILSSVLHTGVIFGPEIIPENLFTISRNKIVSLFRPKSKFIEQLRESKEMQKNLGMFFLKSEYYEGGIDKNELEEAIKKLEEVIENFRQMAEKDKNVYRVLHELIQEQAAYKGNSSYLSRLLLSRKGNCEARAKLMISITNKIYPDLPVKLQMYRDHIRAIVQINDQWYSMEKPTLEPIMEDDLKNTVLAEPSIFVQSYINEKVSVKEIDVTGNSNPPKKLVSDTPFTNLIDPKVSKKLADYSDEMPPDEAEEVRYKFDEVSGVNQNAGITGPIESLPPKKKRNIEITILTKWQIEEILHNRSWFPKEWYKKLNDREKGLVDLYRNKKYEALIKKTNFVPLKGVIDEEAKKFAEYEEMGFAGEIRDWLNQLETAARRIAATKDMNQRQLILCELQQQLNPKHGYHEYSEDDIKRSEKFQKLIQRGLKTTNLDETVDVFILWQSLQELSGFQKSELGPDEEECNKVFKNRR